jgi:DEP domain-containing protein 5
MASGPKVDVKQVTVWLHDDNFSKDEVLVAPDIFGEDTAQPNALIEIVMLKPSSVPGDSGHNAQAGLPPPVDTSSDSSSKTFRGASEQPMNSDHQHIPPKVNGQHATYAPDPHTRYVFIANRIPPDMRVQHPSLQISITRPIANIFGYRQGSQAAVCLADQRTCSASHVELVFRDEYLSRSDMWRLVRSELAGKTVRKGQKIQFLGTIKAMVKTIYIGGRTVSSAYFCQTTIPVFRSESARYVLFIQMSREMWDFDSEGTGEIMFSRVIDGFLPELFKKWVELEARHLVSIVLFGRLEYDRHALAALQRLNSVESEGPSIDIDEKAAYRDFYRVVVTDMASGQWTTILNELKKDFRVFLRDITLHQPREHNFAEGYIEPEADEDLRTRICGQPTSALRGNILEAINIASSQFASDYIDRDLVRTGISVIVITPGTGLFEVNRRLLDLTSENLTNNGIGIDLVCLSKMPLHSVPLFKWSRSPPTASKTSSDTSLSLESPSTILRNQSSAPAKAPGASPSHGSLLQSTPRRKAMSIVTQAQWSFGVPQWIDISYWTSSGQQREFGHRKQLQKTAQFYLNPLYSKAFVPRVRMYELQMMGVMELGLANISIPYISEGRQDNSNHHDRSNGMLDDLRSKAAQFGRLAASPRPILSPRTNSPAHLGRRGRGLLSVQAKQQGDMYERMDAYDERLFHLNPSIRTATSKLRRRNDNSYPILPEQDSYWHTSSIARRGSVRVDTSDTDTITSTKRTNTIKSQSSSSQPKGLQTTTNPPDSRISRTISFALRGLGPSAPRAVASTEINVENIQAEHAISNLPPHTALGDTSKGWSSAANNKMNRLSMLSFGSEGSEVSDPGHFAQPSIMSSSRPISIKNKAQQNDKADHRSKFKVPSSVEDPHKTVQKQDFNLDAENSEAVLGSGQSHEAEPEKGTALHLSTSEISPWIKNVNPANPTKNRSKAESRVGRWQHLYPRAPRASSVKWKSLCTPASVPLTTEVFPTKEEWDTRYTQASYAVSQTDDKELVELPKGREWLLREMVGLRLAHGYQLVVGRNLAKAIGSDTTVSTDYLTPENLARDGAKVFMSMGNTVQELLCIGTAKVQVTRYVREPEEATDDRKQYVAYGPVIRTILSKSYSLRAMTLAGFSEEYPWSLADSYIAGHKADLTKLYEQLRFWRARFVVIPVEPPPSARRPIQSMSEDNEEEIHLLGIRELTKLWQKARYIAPEERRFKPTPGKRKDPNPLEIIFQTLNTSEAVATEIEKLLVTDDAADSRQIQLLPDSELLERSTSTVSKIAQLLQGEKGVEITNRRWHILLHTSCFKGDDFTNWLISSFKDIDSREEAVEFGNELMQHGLFHHVSTRHTFKDGNYFYEIAREHRITPPESRSWRFPSGRRPDRSVPATPITDSGSHVSPLSSQSQLNWNSARTVDTRTSEKSSGDKRQLSVSLTKMMRIDVDHRNPKRSDRPEIVNLHYDRLHNPENCYHMELSWFNVTSKLVEDAIVNWATQLEKYGLRLVEVPIAEACNISDREPFRAPYRIVLKVPPPPLAQDIVGNGTTCSTNTLFVPQTAPTTDRLHYHKALLRKFNFVLDLEAASDFPPDVDVTYTWGKLGYRYPQFIHRSGVILAQITDDGELVLLANRLYNTRSASTKESAGKLETKNNSHHRPTPASGIVGLNHQNLSPHPSPLVRASSDVLGSTDALNASDIATSITPEQIKDELEQFCHDAKKLQAFYKETSERGPPLTRKSGSSSSSVLRPVPGCGLDSSIPDLRLPSSVVTVSSALSKGLGTGLTKKSSPKPAGRERTVPDTLTTDFPRQTSEDLD